MSEPGWELAEGPLELRTAWRFKVIMLCLQPVQGSPGDGGAQGWPSMPHVLLIFFSGEPHCYGFLFLGMARGSRDRKAGCYLRAGLWSVACENSCLGRKAEGQGWCSPSFHVQQIPPLELSASGAQGGGGARGGIFIPAVGSGWPLMPAGLCPWLTLGWPHPGRAVPGSGGAEVVPWLGPLLGVTQQGPGFCS